MADTGTEATLIGERRMKKLLNDGVVDVSENALRPSTQMTTETTDIVERLKILEALAEPEPRETFDNIEDLIESLHS